jgi:DNA/RNA endonuclease G, NUC1
LGEPDLSVLLGTNKNNPDYNKSRAGFTKETDPTVGIAGRGAVHGRVLSWYGGTSDLFPTNFPFNENLDANPIFRRRGDGYREPLFDKDFSFSNIANNSARVTPWYTPEERFEHGVDAAPWEGIGTGWFYSVLGGGKELRPQTNVERIPVDFDNTYDARMRGDAAVPTLFNGNFDAVFNPQGGNRTIFSNAIPGWSFHNGETSASVTTNNLVDVNQLSASDAPALHAELDRIGVDRTKPNYALKLESGKSITHNRFVVPESGTLRFNLHVPNPSGGQLKVSIKGTESTTEEWQDLTPIELTRAANPDTLINPLDPNSLARPNAVGYYDYNVVGYSDPYTNKLAYAEQGFETFHLKIPDNLRDKPALLQFKVEGGSEVYLDDVFFNSVHLKLGNPTFARPSEDTHRENYLIEKPQYSLSYNDATKGPNWVSWQLNKSWLGTIGQGDLKLKDRNKYPPVGFPPPILDSGSGMTLTSPDSSYPPGYFVDYPWSVDPTLPDTWVKTQGPDYRRNQRNFERGHMTAAAERSRTYKDIYSTFLTTNLLPQHEDNNGGMWAQLEDYGRNQLVKDNNRELYIIAGGFDYSPAVPPGHSDLREINNKISTNTQGRVILDSNGTLTPNPKTIGIPNYTWKIIVPLEPGQGIADVTANTQVIAVITPNRRSRETPAPNYRLPDSPSYPNGFLPNGVTNWKNWQQWRVNVDYLEALTGYDFLSNLPEEIQEVIETDSSSPLV